MVQGINRRYPGEGAGLEPEQQGEGVQVGHESTSEGVPTTALEDFSESLSFFSHYIDSLANKKITDKDIPELKSMLKQVSDAAAKAKDKVS